MDVSTRPGGGALSFTEDERPVSSARLLTHLFKLGRKVGMDEPNQQCCFRVAL